MPSGSQDSGKELSAQMASAQADFAVDMVRKLDGAVLDFSVDSLSHIDRLLQSFHNNGDRSSAMPGVATAFGCYIGEVVARTLKGRWVDSRDTPAARFIEGSIPLVQLSNGYLANPIGKAFKALDNGAEDNVMWFYQVTKEHA